MKAPGECRSSVQWQSRRTLTAVDVFACPACNVTPEVMTEGNAQLAIVRHQLGCPTLLPQSRTRWADEPAGLPHLGLHSR